MKFIISESQYRRIIKEQGIIGNLISSFGRNMGPAFRGIPRTAPRPRIDLSKGPKPGFGGGRFGRPDNGVDIDLPNGYSFDCCIEYKTAEEIVKELFDLCLKRPNRVTDQEWDKINSWTKRLIKSVTGAGTSSDFMKVLSEFKTLDDLSAVVKKYPLLENESLFEAISGEWFLSWEEIVKALIKFIDELKIQDCKEKDPLCA